MTLRRSLLASGVALATLLAGAFGNRAAAQTGTLGAPVPITLAATAADRLVVVVMSGGTQTIPNLTPNAINQFPTPVQIYTEWNLPYFFGGTLSLVAYFTNPGAGAHHRHREHPGVTGRGSHLGHRSIAPHHLDADQRQRRWRRRFRRRHPALWEWPGYCGLLIFCRQGDRTDQLDLRLNLVGYPTSAGTYAGVLNIRAVIY